MFLFPLTRNGIFLCEGTHHKLRSFHLTLVASWKKKIFTGQREHFHVSRGWCMNTTDYGLMKQNAASHLFTSHEPRTSLCRTYIRYQDTTSWAGGLILHRSRCQSRALPPQALKSTMQSTLVLLVEIPLDNNIYCRPPALRRSFSYSHP